MSDLPRLAFTFGALSNRVTLSQITDLNTHSLKYGLHLSEKGALQILAARDESLRRSGRLELGNQVIQRIITVFSASPYINQADYADTVCELIDIFYYVKNESLEQIPDEELIDIMKDFFDNSCAGSLELLSGRELELLVRDLLFKPIPDYYADYLEEQFNGYTEE